jgi:hypothetical protein
MRDNMTLQSTQPDMAKQNERTPQIISTFIFASRQGGGSTMKFYLYVSDAKLDMLYAQIPPTLRSRFAKELKIDLKVVSASFTEATKEDGRYGKVEVVRRYLDDHLPIGTVSNPQAYFAGTIPMRWGAVTGAAPGEMVIFGGEWADITVGLAGSRHHIVGYRGEGMVTPGTPGFAGSGHVKGILEQMESSLSRAVNPDGERQSPQAFGPPQQPVDATTEALGVVVRATRGLRGPTQPVEFMAKRLLMGMVDLPGGQTAKVLLGTPIYVATAD